MEIEINQVRAAQYTPESINDEERSVRITVATDAPVLSYDWKRSILFWEKLSFDKSHVNMDRVGATRGVPLLDNHNTWTGATGVHGKVTDPTLGSNEMAAMVRFSRKDTSEKIYQDVKDGILDTFSAGYSVRRYKDITSEADRTRIANKEEGVFPTWLAVDWTLKEVSLAPVPADPKSRTRSDIEKSFMIPLEDEVIVTENDGQRSDNQNTNTKPNMEKTQAEIRAEQDQIRKEIREAESQRVADIRQMAKDFKIKDEHTRADSWIANGDSVDVVRAAIQAEYAKQEAAPSPAPFTGAAPGQGGDEKSRAAGLMADAILMKANKVAQDDQNKYRGLHLVEIARESLMLEGVRAELMTPQQVVNEAMRTRTGEMGTSDFPNILMNAMHKYLRKAYELQGQTFKAFGTPGVLSDFRPTPRIQTGSIPTLPKVSNDGEYTRLKFNDGKESNQLETYGGIVTITRKAILQDDLSAFDRIPKILMDAAHQTESNEFYRVLFGAGGFGAPMLTDGVAIFNAAHNNLIASATAIGLPGLQAARTLMRNQKALDNTSFLNLTPKYLVCGPLNETLAEQYTSSSFQAMQQSNIAPKFNTRLEVIIEPRITSLDWYLVADPAVIDTIEYAYLQGQGGLYLEQKMGFNTDGIDIKARLDYGVAPLDFRGMVLVKGQ